MCSACMVLNRCTQGAHSPATRPASLSVCARHYLRSRILVDSDRSSKRPDAWMLEVGFYDHGQDALGPWPELSCEASRLQQSQQLPESSYSIYSMLVQTLIISHPS